MPKQATRASQRDVAPAGDAPVLTGTRFDPALYTAVTLKRAVMVDGHLYRPGLTHVVDAATLAKFGDDIGTSKSAG